METSPSGGLETSRQNCTNMEETLLYHTEPRPMFHASSFRDFLKHRGKATTTSGNGISEWSTIFHTRPHLLLRHHKGEILYHLNSRTDYDYKVSSQ